MKVNLMSTDYSITLTPSHDCVPVLMDFIIDHAKPPYPKRRELADMLSELDRVRIRRLNMKISKGVWHVEFIVNENVKYIGDAEDFDMALAKAFSKVHSRLCANAG